MLKIKFASLFAACFFTLFCNIAFAQTSFDTNIQRAQLPPDVIFKGTGRFSDFDQPSDDHKESNQELNDQQKELMRRINKIYEIHVQSVRAEITDQPLAAEEHIMKALKAVQELMDDNPKVQTNERFRELYRTVYTEYRSFYGIKDINNEEKGEVFAVHRQLFNSDNDWMKGKYVLPENITKPKTKVPLVYNDKVNRHLMFYSSKRPQIMQEWLERSQKYFPMMKRIFREEGVPPELVHLSMIESGLNPKARSWASAVGMWQFIQATGAMYGLEVNWWMDERRDPEKATRAAARHLKDLYQIWGNWYLAIANYNISPRGLKRAIRAGGGKEDFWSAYPYLPRETQGYIPSFIATTIIDRNSKAFGFKDKRDYHVKQYSYDVAEVAPLMPLTKLAQAAGISKEQLKNYNPELLRWATPPGGKYPLKLPSGTKRKFVANYNKIPQNQRSNSVAVHTVSRGETLGYIAQRYGSTVRAIYASNKGLTSTIHPGQKIVVPMAPGSSKRITARKPSNGSKTNHSSSHPKKRSARRAKNGLSAVNYTVKRGDNVGFIAEWYDVRASQIRAWNRTSNTINVGEKLKIYVADSKQSYYRRVNSFSFSKKQRIEREQHQGKDVTTIYTADAGKDGTVKYTVRKNDTLAEIAHTFGTSVHHLKQTNNLKSSRIYVGQRLRINTTN